MIKLLTVLFLVSFAAGEVININYYFDYWKLQIDVALAKIGLGSLKLPDISDSGVHLSNGVLLGLNSLKRTSDWYMTTYDNGTCTLDLHLGWNLLVAAFGLIEVTGDEMSGLFRARENSFHFSLTTSPPEQPDCKVVLGDFSLETFGNVTLDASLPDYDGDVSALFRELVNPQINDEIASRRDQVESVLQDLFCNESEVSLAPTETSDKLNYLIMRYNKLVS